MYVYMSMSLQNYSMAVYLVKQLASTVLLQRLRSKGIRNPDHSRALSTGFKHDYMLCYIVMYMYEMRNPPQILCKVLCLLPRIHGSLKQCEEKIE